MPWLQLLPFSLPSGRVSGLIEEKIESAEHFSTWRAHARHSSYLLRFLSSGGRFTLLFKGLAAELLVFEAYRLVFEAKSRGNA
jgi:hypothetical protein